MALGYLSGSNGFIPKATGQVVGYIRRPDRFALNTYCQYVKSDKVIALYAKVSRDEPVRIVTREEYTWHDGEPAPDSDDGSVPYELLPIQIIRNRFGWKLGYDSIDQTEGTWEPKLVHVATATSKAMTARTMEVIKLLETTANWNGHTTTAVLLNGNTVGHWDLTSSIEGDLEYLSVSKTFNEVVLRVHLDTNNVVGIDDMRCMMAPKTAQAVAQGPEIRSYLRESPYAKGELTYEDRKFSATWGLPRYYQGVQIIVEASVRVTRRPQIDMSETTFVTDATRVQLKSPDSVVFMSRPGGIDGEFGAPSYSTLQLYYYKHLLTVRAFDEPRHFRVIGDVIDQYAPILAAPMSGYLVTDVLSP